MDKDIESAYRYLDINNSKIDITKINKEPA